MVNPDAPKPAKSAPLRAVIEGRYCRLEPIAAEHARTLYEAAAAPGAEDRFRWLFEVPPSSEREIATWIERVRVPDDPLFFAVIDKATSRCEGRQAFMRIVPEHGVIEIGSILWGPAIARTRVATEALYLFARHAFEDLGYRRFEWKCNNLNEPSNRAALRFGFSYEGLFHQHMIVKGASRDTAWFAMIDRDWPALKAAYEAWLDPANFDAEGRQRMRLAAAAAVS
jgi:RimJ/RimL family protein N-acetyltransferase